MIEWVLVQLLVIVQVSFVCCSDLWKEVHFRLSVCNLGNFWKGSIWDIEIYTFVGTILRYFLKFESKQHLYYNPEIISMVSDVYNKILFHFGFSDFPYFPFLQVILDYSSFLFLLPSFLPLAKLEMFSVYFPASSGQDAITVSTITLKINPPSRPSW